MTNTTQTDRLTDGRMCTRMNEWIYGWIDIYTDAQKRLMHKQADRQTDG